LKEFFSFEQIIFRFVARILTQNASRNNEVVFQHLVIIDKLLMKTTNTAVAASGVGGD